MKNVNSDVAYDFIRKKILSGDYTPGQALVTNELSTEIGVSRTPIRDALRQLESDGLVSIRAHLGASVKTMDLKEYRELCGIRLALESYAAGLAAVHHNAEDLKEMRFAMESMRKLTDQIPDLPKENNAIAALVREDVRFHIAIMSAAKSDLIKKEILRLHLINRVISSAASEGVKRSPDRDSRDANRRAVLRSHQQIFKAIESGNAAAAKQAMEEHIQDIIEKNIILMGDDREGSARTLTEEELSYTT